mmetsp:Transcript_3462/g.12164  ORF Transcript_3462/g.12164 Transcript_3462/m.12164 type:complete len:207 (+) Transcript_3462:66-686(+)
MSLPRSSIISGSPRLEWTNSKDLPVGPLGMVRVKRFFLLMTWPQLRVRTPARSTVGITWRKRSSRGCRVPPARTTACASRTRASKWVAALSITNLIWSASPPRFTMTLPSSSLLVSAKSRSITAFSEPSFSGPSSPELSDAATASVYPATLKKSLVSRTNSESLKMLMLSIPVLDRKSFTVTISDPGAACSAAKHPRRASTSLSTI